jgi:hypothetical protein
VKILIISDVHGNADALNALNESYDELWVLGDLVTYGPEPAEVVQHLRQHASLIVRGNHDHAVGYSGDPRCSPPFRAMAEATRQHAMKTLSDGDVSKRVGRAHAIVGSAPAVIKGTPTDSSSPRFLRGAVASSTVRGRLSSSIGATRDAGPQLQWRGDARPPTSASRLMS